MNLLAPNPLDKHPSLDNIKTEEVTEIIENMPTKFGLLVTSIIFVLIFLTILFGWIVQYPDVLTGQIVLNTRQAPVKIVSNTSGNISFLAANKERVKKGDYIAYIKNGVDPLDIQRIKRIVDTVNIHKINSSNHRHLFPENVVMGSINQDYFNFLNSLYQYLDFLSEKSFDKGLNSLNNQLESQKDLLKSEDDNYISEHEKYLLQLGFYTRDSILFSKRVISSQELEKSRQNLVMSKQQYNYLKKNLTSDKYAIRDSENKIQQLRIENREKVNALSIAMIHTYYQLKESIETWERKFVFISPMAGKVAYLNFWKNEDFINAGTDLVMIVPSEGNIIGQVTLPEKGAGKVVVGQDVIIKLDNFPYTQFGSVRGKVINISTVTNEQLVGNNIKQSAYLITVSLPRKLKTNYGTTLSFHTQAKGTADVITDQRRLIERLFDNLKHSTH
ncbi:HlyD family efflux transporter periplasmic adaptor subunit [Agrobacterium tumefaciens]|nr:HlyD family efflux transporter periplasmic adaptor subunit [Agrobacterium tumefaciens]NTE22195.1 HlyD family efflux transporter periplasmic adaptor subunit [Agrobacterium tumefaciens]